MKKPPSKVAHNRPKIIFFSTGPAAQMAQKQKFRTTKSPLMQQDWVFRLGAYMNENIAMQDFHRTSNKTIKLTMYFLLFKSTGVGLYL